MFCSECGSQAEDGARFCATCGAPLGATVEQPLPDAEPVGAGPEVAPAEPTRRAPAEPPASPLAAVSGLASGKNLAPKLLAAAGLIALVVVVVVLVNGLGGGAGGADSPVAAVRDLASAAEKADVAAALATIAPDESGDIADLYAELRKHVGGLVRSDGRIAGAKVSVSHLQLDSEDLGHGVAKVRATSGQLAVALKGTGTSSVLLPSDASTEASTQIGGEGYEYVMARKQDGKWFVSPVLTALQQIVDAADLPQPDFALLDEKRDDAKAAKTPQELLSGIAQAVTDRNVSALLDLLSNRELGVLRAYRAAADELVSRIGGSLEVSVSDADVKQTSHGSGRVRLDVRHVSANAKLSTDYDGADVALRLNGLCLDVQGSTSFHGCDTQVHRIFGVSDPFLIAELDGGSLRLAPIATLKAYLDELIDNVGDAGVKRLAGTVASTRASATLTSGSAASGHLNEGGYAIHGYKGSADELLAIDTDRSAMLVGPDGAPVRVQACVNGTALFQLPSAGNYRVIVAAGKFEPLAYRVLVEHVTATDAGVPSVVSGTVGEGARVAVVKFDKPGSDVQFTTDSPVSSTIVDPTSDSYQGYSCSYGLIGPASLFVDQDDSAPESLSSGDGNAYTYEGDVTGERLLVIAGARGARFRGTLAEQTSGG